MTTGGSGDFADRLVRRFFLAFENPRTRARMVRLVRSSFSSARTGRVFYRALRVGVVNPVARATGVQTSALKVELALGQLTGVAIMRYVLKAEPLASADVEDVISQVTPGVRATLKG